MKTVAERYDEAAKKKGLHIVCACGFDCVPSDLGVLFTVTEARKKGHELHLVDGFINLKGGPSGGTINTILTMFDLPKSEMKQSMGPFSLLPPSERPAASSLDRDQYLPAYSRKLGCFTSFFALCVGDAQVVRKSAHYNQYSPSFHYRECYFHRGGFLKSGLSAVFITLFWLVGLILVLIPCTRKLLRKVLPQPGQGPSQEVMDKGRFTVRLIGSTAEGKQVIQTSVSGGEPGYKETSRMLGESALCLAFDQLKSKGGAETPAMAMGEALIKRIQGFGIKFQVEN